MAAPPEADVDAYLRASVAVLMALEWNPVEPYGLPCCAPRPCTTAPCGSTAAEGVTDLVGKGQRHQRQSRPALSAHILRYNPCVQPMWARRLFI